MLGTRRHLTGFHCNGNFTSHKPRPRQRPRQRKRSLRRDGQCHGAYRLVDRGGSTQPTQAHRPGPPKPASLLVSCWPMIDPADDLTRPLPVASTCPIRMQFAAPDRLHTVVLMQDLFEQWVLIQGWAGPGAVQWPLRRQVAAVRQPGCRHRGAAGHRAALPEAGLHADRRINRGRHRAIQGTGRQGSGAAVHRLR